MERVVSQFGGRMGQSSLQVKNMHTILFAAEDASSWVLSPRWLPNGSGSSWLPTPHDVVLLVIITLSYLPCRQRIITETSCFPMFGGGGEWSQMVQFSVHGDSSPDPNLFTYSCSLSNVKVVKWKSGVRLHSSAIAHLCANIWQTNRQECGGGAAIKNMANVYLLENVANWKTWTLRK